MLCYVLLHNIIQSGCSPMFLAELTENFAIFKFFKTSIYCPLEEQTMWGLTMSWLIDSDDDNDDEDDADDA